MKSIFFFLFIFLNLDVYAKDSALKEIMKHKEIKFVMDVGVKPWIWIKADGSYTGFEYEIVKEVTQYIDQKLKLDGQLKLTIIPAPWEQMGDWVIKDKKGHIAINGMYKPGSEEVKKDQAWSDCYYKTGVSVMYHSSQKTPTLEDLKKSNSIMTYPDPHVLETLKKLGIKDVKQNENDHRYARYIKRKKYEYILADSAFVYWEDSKGRYKDNVASTRKIIPNTEGCYAALGSKNNSELIQYFNEALSKLQKQKKDTEIFKKYGI